MAGAGITVEINEAEIQEIIDALRRASAPQLRKVAAFAGEDLKVISEKAFQDQKNPATGEGWARLKHPRGKEAKSPGSTSPILQDHGQLRRSLIYEAFPDGSVIFGSNVIYSRIHQEGGTTKAHEIKARNAKALHFNGVFRKSVKHPGSKIPARPFLGVPQGFDRMILSDPEILRLLGIEP